MLEGFIDFLSLKQLGKDAIPTIEHSDFLVLNSLSFLSKNLGHLKDHSDVSLFLDNDTAGRRAKLEIESAGIHFKDLSDLYKSFKDVNEYLVDLQNTLGRRKVMKL